MVIKVGCCGFAESMTKYFKDFNLIEIQKTFYTFPKTSTVKRWREKAGDDFEFTIKASQLITHDPSSPTYKKAKINIPDDEKDKYGFFRNTDEVFEAWEKTKEIAEILKSRVVVFQTPAKFKETKENIENIMGFFSAIEGDFNYVLEIRGKWNIKTIKKICEEFNITHCTDVLVEKPVYIGDLAYFRLHGSKGERIYRYKHTKEDFEEIYEHTSNLDVDCYILFNNIYMLEDAKRFKEFISQKFTQH